MSKMVMQRMTPMTKETTWFFVREEAREQTLR
jgi:hypothetical protein